ncbi:MAG: hypothetical protein Q7S34_04230 [bacterium]|nr:hypothetical protein [bacterium]
MKKFFKKFFDFLLNRGVIEPRFDSKYPGLSKEYVGAVKKLADNKVNMRFLTSDPPGPIFPRYKIHPLKGVSLLFGWLWKVLAKG